MAQSIIWKLLGSKLAEDDLVPIKQLETNVCPLSFASHRGWNKTYPSMVRDVQRKLFTTSKTFSAYFLTV